MAISGERDYSAAARLGQSSVQQFKSAFFDRDIILRAMDKAAHKALSRFGAFVRQRARTSLRYRQAVSAPGSPPSAHRTMSRAKTNKKTGVTKVQDVSPLREFILFAYLQDQQAVIIGPAKTNQQNARGMHGLTVPQVLEYGGQVAILEYLAKGFTVKAGSRGRDGKFRAAGVVPDHWRRVDLRSPRRAAGRPQRSRMASYSPRPYMTPAFHTELPQLVRFFHNSI